MILLDAILWTLGEMIRLGMSLLFCLVLLTLALLPVYFVVKLSFWVWG